ncbi:MAG: putative regulatory protein FmdB family [Actinomycetia bacterium]|nr:putative regulatory protein FmdB family [Actinomycetes bacterium]
MPTYEYRCAKCGEQLEVFQSFSEKPLTRHASCGGKLSKVMSAAGVILKGSGFYKTDSRAAAKNGGKRHKTNAESSNGSDSSSSSSSESSSKSSDSSSKSSDSSSSSSSSNGSSGSDAKPAKKSA